MPPLKLCSSRINGIYSVKLYLKNAGEKPLLSIVALACPILSLQKATSASNPSVSLTLLTAPCSAPIDICCVASFEGVLLSVPNVNERVTADPSTHRRNVSGFVVQSTST